MRKRGARDNSSVAKGERAAHEIIDSGLRLLTAVICGAIVGVNRELHHKPAGLRTHALVALGSALAIVAICDPALTPERRADIGSRVTQGIITGIGFLGGGVILRDTGSPRVHGLTTAAAIWVTALFGVGCGLGAYRAVGIGVALVLVILVVGGPIERIVHRLAGWNPSDFENGGKRGSA